ncbi:MAG: ATPase, partial [Myxococcales bacterium]|nr:ATPase [Myxococcales bacterium]
TAPIGPEIAPLAPLIDAVDTTPADALREYALMVLKVRALYRAVFENRVVAKLLRVMPGLPELTMLGKAYYHETERTADGRPRYDVVIVDAPATGHGMFLLQIPQVISSALNAGRMAEESAKMLALLEDHRRTIVNIVTLPEEMPANEAIELHARLRSEFDVRVGAVIVNQVLARSLDDRDARLARELASTHRDSRDDLGALLDAALFREQRCAMQAEHIERLGRTLDVPIVEVPFYFEPAIDRTLVDRMGAHVEQVFGRTEAAR